MRGHFHPCLVKTSHKDRTPFFDPIDLETLTSHGSPYWWNSWLSARMEGFSHEQGWQADYGHSRSICCTYLAHDCHQIRHGCIWKGQEWENSDDRLVSWVCLRPPKKSLVPLYILPESLNTKIIPHIICNLSFSRIRRRAAYHCIDRRRKESYIDPTHPTHTPWN